MLRILPLITSTASIVAAPATSLSMPAAPVSQSLTPRSVTGTEIVSSLLDFVAKDPQLVSTGLLPIARFQTYSDTFMQPLVVSLQRAFQTSYENAPLTNPFNRLVTDYGDFVKAHPSIELDFNKDGSPKSPTDQALFKGFIDKFEADSTKVTDHFRDTINQVNAFAGKIAAAGIQVDNPSQGPVSSLGEYYATKFVNDVAGSSLGDYYEALALQVADIQPDTFLRNISFSVMEHITEQQVLQPLDSLFDQASVVPSNELKKYGLSELEKRFKEKVATLKANEEAHIRQLFRDFDHDRTITKFTPIIDALEAETQSDPAHPTSQIAQAITTAKDDLIKEVDGDIQHLLDAHVTKFSYTEAKIIDTLAIDKFFDPIKWREFYTKWNGGVAPRSFAKIAKVESAGTDSNVNFELQIKVGPSVINDQGQKWQPVLIPIEVSLLDFVNEVKSSAQNGQLGIPDFIKSDISSVNFEHMVAKDVVGLNYFDALSPLTDLIPRLATLYPTLDLTSQFAVFVSKIPGLTAEVIKASPKGIPNADKTQDYNIDVKFTNGKAQGDADYEEQILPLVIKGVPIHDVSRFEDYATKMKAMLQTDSVNANGISVPAYYALEVQRFLDALHKTEGDLAAASQGVNPDGLQWDWTKLFDENGNPLPDVITDARTLWANIYGMEYTDKDENGNDVPAKQAGMLTNQYDPKITPTPNPMLLIDPTGMSIIPGASPLKLISKPDGSYMAQLTYKIVSTTLKIDGTPLFSSREYTAQIRIASLNLAVDDAIAVVSSEPKGFFFLTDRLQDQGSLSAADHQQIKDDIQAIIDKFKIDVADSSKVRTKEDVEKLRDEFITKIQAKEIESLDKIPNVGTQITPLKDALATATAQVATAQAAVDQSQKEYDDLVALYPTPTQDQQDQLDIALSKLAYDQDQLKQKQEVQKQAMDDLTEVVTRLTQVAGFVKDAFNDPKKEEEIKESVRDEVANYIATADLTSLPDFENLKALIDMPLEHTKVNLSAPMKYVLVALGGFIGLVGAGITFSSLRSIKTNRNINAMEDAPIENIKPKKALALKMMISVAALGTAAAVITLVLTLGGGL